VSSRIKKQRDKMARKVIDKKISVAEGQRRAGGKYARKAASADLVKMQRAQAGQAAETMRQAADALRSARPVTDDDLLDAVRTPMPRSPLGKAAGAGQVPREDPQRAAAPLKSRRSPGAETPPAPPVPPVHWAPIDLELLHRAEYHDDPAERETARKYLVNKGMLWGEPEPDRSGTAATQTVIWTPGNGPGFCIGEGRKVN
jgi:hypothetical protein